MTPWAGKKIHFMGAGGIGVSALMELAYRQGALVSGCDARANEMTLHLEQLGIPVSIGHHESHVRGMDLLVYSSAISEEHPERQAVSGMCRQMRRGTFMAELLKGKRVFGVCGTHGKTTTAWLLGQLLVACSMDPTIILGGIGAGEKSNLRLGRSDLVVVELDESDGSFLEPELALGVVTSVEADHLDHYGTPEKVLAAFRAFASQLGKDGVLVVNADDDGAGSIAGDSDCHVVSVGSDKENDLRLLSFDADGGKQKLVLANGEKAEHEVDISLPGTHNRNNAMCAIAAARAVGATWEQLAAALPECRSVGRRFEMVGEKKGITVVDDYAHHPTEVRVTLEAARELAPGRLIAVFQPHLYSRTRDFAEDFGSSLAIADLIILVDIYPAREKPLPGIDSSLVIEAVRIHNENVIGPFAQRRVASEVAAIARPGDMVMFLGAGDVGKCAYELMERL